MEDKLISEYIDHQASKEELDVLHQWIGKSSANRSKFSREKNLDAFVSSITAGPSEHADFAGLEKHLKKSGSASVISNLKKIYRYAAIILFPVVLGVGIYLTYNSYYSTEAVTPTKIIAPSKHISKVVLPDGSMVWLSPESTLEYFSDFGKRSRMVYLSGQGYFEVSKDRKRFYVETDRVEVQVFGTKFNIEAYPDDPRIKTTLVEGQIKVKIFGLDKELEIDPGEQVSYNINKKTIHVEQVETGIYEGVKYGVLVFKRNNLTEVCNILERWFMIPIIYDGKGSEEVLFTAKFKDESIDDILKVISETIPIKYQIDDEKIYISYK